VSRAETFDHTAIRAYLRRATAVIDRHAGYLTRLDETLGDGDHGDNLLLGFRSLAPVLDDTSDPDAARIGFLLRTVGRSLAANVGGASGPLYATAFIEAAEVAGDATVVHARTVAQMFRAAAAGVARRGRCDVGDKTMLDTLRPATAAMADVLEADGSFADALRDGARAAARGMRSTRPLVARRGLAIRLGDRSAGHLDPGAVSCLLLVRALAPSAAERRRARALSAVAE
jgi:dihydroxyacetone kinase-like protein